MANFDELLLPRPQKMIISELQVKSKSQIGGHIGFLHVSVFIFKIHFVARKIKSQL